MCNCNNSIKHKKMSHTKMIIKKLWENSQFSEKDLIIKKINKS